MVAFATQVKRRRGTTAQNDAFTGAEGEIVVDTQKHTLRVHDGETQGGFEMATQADLNNKADTSYIDGLLATKADTDLGNIPTNYDYVVEKQDPTSANGYTWYRKYKSGWVEQGGTATTPTNGDLAITLPIPMNPNQFYVTNSSRQPINNWAATPTITKSTNGTTIRIAVVPNSGAGAWVSGTIDWQVSGYEA